jgi:protein involved in polysaccharide export with SLBB domain
MIQRSLRMFCVLLLAVMFQGIYAPRLHAQQAYALRPGDTIQVWMPQADELRQDVLISPDGGISLPLVGHMQAQGLTLVELEDTIRERLKPFYKKTDLTLMLRPGRDAEVYVVGEVTTPGAYPYRSGMTVLHAISVAGGLYRAAVLPADQDRSVIVGRQVSDGTQRLRELAARIARLEAETAGRRTLTLDRDSVGDPIAIQEQRLLEARMESLAIAEAAEKQAEALNERSRRALEEQIQTVTRRIELSKERLQSITTLVAKGGAESSQKNRYEAEIAELEGVASQLASENVVLERAKADDAARYQAARQDRRTQLLTELQAARREHAEIAARLSDSRRIMSIYGTSAAAAQERAQQALIYTIVRSQNGEPVEAEVTETSPIQPNDLVRVRYGAKAQSVGAAAREGAQAVEPVALASRQEAAR